MSIERLAAIGVVVKDLEAAMGNYARVLGVTEWQVAEVSDDAARSHGRTNAGGYRSARGVAGAIPYELVQPTTGETAFKEFLLTKGEGICFLSFVVDEVPQLDLTVAHEIRAAQGEARQFLDTRKVLGGYLVEFTTTAAPLPGAQDVTVERPAGVGDPIPMDHIFHFGVLVDDVMATLPHYRDIFGIDSFAMKTWQHERGRLDDPMYRGEKKSTGYFTAQGFVADVGFEIIQVNYGDCHYNREFTDDRGTGIHHIFPWMTRDESEWQRACANAKALDAGLCMGSPLRDGAAEFGYWDTFEALGGYLIEGVIRRHEPAPEYAEPDWTVTY